MLWEAVGERDAARGCEREGGAVRGRERRRCCERLREEGVL